MSAIVRLTQGSPEWHEHRSRYRNASETPAVMGVSPFQTPYQLWQVKLGLVKVTINPAMQRGTDLEPAARAAYERQTGRIMQPLVVVDGEYSASLDGLTLDGKRLVEIKCPFKGCDSTLFKAVEAGSLPENYQWQVAHQLMVTKAEVADVYVFDGTEGIMLQVVPDPSTWPRIYEAWDAFAQCVTTGQAPPLSDRDAKLREDPEWLSAATAYVEAKRAVDVVATSLEEAKTRLVGLASHAKEQGGGVSVTRLWKRGNVDYKRIPEIAGIDLEQYRSAPREETRITAA